MGENKASIFLDSIMDAYKYNTGTKNSTRKQIYYFLPIYIAIYIHAGLKRLEHKIKLWLCFDTS